MSKFLQFAGGNGRIFNANYEIKNPFVSTKPKFPSLSDYDSESKYNSAVQQWKKQIIEGSENTLLPLPISLSVSTPQMFPLSNRNDNIPDPPNGTTTKAVSLPKYFDYRENPPLPATCAELFDQLVDNNPKTNLKKSVVHVKNQKEVPINFYIYEKNSWGSDLIPQEPPAELFDSYAAYKAALKKWSKSCSKSWTLHHPSEFSSLIGIVSNDSKSQSKNSAHNKISSPETQNNSVSLVPNQYFFDKQTLSKMKSKKIPNSDLLQSLYDSVYNHQSPKANTKKFSELEKLPFQIPYKALDIIDKSENVTDTNSESIRLVNMMHCYKFISDHFVSHATVKNPAIDHLTLDTDLTPAQFHEILNQLKPREYEKLIHNLSFYLHQLHIVKSNRIRCRYFVLFEHILQKKPRDISHFYADPLSLSNTAEIIHDFSFLDSKIYSYVDDEIFNSIDQHNSVNQIIKDLVLSLFVNQLSRLLLLYIKKYQIMNNNTLLIQINAQTMTFNRFINDALREKLKQIETAFSEPRPIHCVIFHFLCDYDAVSLASVFQTLPFFVFLGKVKTSESCSQFYGGLCNHILHHPKLRQILYENFFRLPFKLANKKSMMCVIATSSFLTSLIDNESSESKIELSYDDIFRTLLELTQLVQLSADEPLLLINSIVNAYLKQVKMRSITTNLGNSNIQITCSPPAISNPMTANIQESIMTLFQAPNLTIANISMIYDMMNLFLIPYRNENRDFMNRYVHSILFKNMVSDNEELMILSWKEFRALLLDPSTSSIRDLSEIKSSLANVINKKKFSPAVKIQILLLSVGFTQKPGTSSQRRLSTGYATQELQKKRKPRKLSSPLEQNDSFLIPGINVLAMFEDVLDKFNQGQLKEYSNEIALLKILVPIFKTRKKLILPL